MFDTICWIYLRLQIKVIKKCRIHILEVNIFVEKRNTKTAPLKQNFWISFHLIFLIGTPIPSLLVA